MSATEIRCSFCGDDIDIQFNCESHGLCIDCCSTWLKSISVDAGKLRTHASMNWIGCPGLSNEDGALAGQWCDCPIPFETIPSNVETIDDFFEAAERIWKSRQDELVDTLNLRCPSCRTVLDPEAEACTAMCCSYCSAQFCFACLEQFPNQETAHQHVPLVHGERSCI